MVYVDLYSYNVLQIDSVVWQEVPPIFFFHEVRATYRTGFEVWDFCFDISSPSTPVRMRQSRPAPLVNESVIPFHEANRNILALPFPDELPMRIRR